MELFLKNITKKYGDKKVVNNITTSMTPGVYALLGANGAGKTTLMRMMTGILEPTSGEILFDKENIKEMGSEYRSILGYLPQDFGHYPNYSAKDFLLYIATLKGITAKTAKSRVLDLAEKVGLSDVINKKIKTFSGGMKQRLGIAQAILNDPYILIMDEPTAGLDPKERVKFRNLISSLAQNRIVILSTHIVSDVEAIADKVFLMKHGEFVSEGGIQKLVEEVDGHVWELKVDPKEVDKWEAETTVANLRRENENTILRIISEESPSEYANPVAATLEDLYLYHFPMERGE